MRKFLLLTATMFTAALTAGQAHAALSFAAQQGGAPVGSGITYENFDSLTGAAATAGGSLSTGVTVVFINDGKAVTGGVDGLYAAPYLSGANGAQFGTGSLTGPDPSVYLTSGSTSAFSGASISFVFAAPKQYLGLLWGSVDQFNTLTFYSGDTQVGAINGAAVLANASGDQGINGTRYVNINSTVGFDRVVATSSDYAFEIDNMAFSANPVPEPVTLSLLGAGLAGLAFARRRKA